jgi:hypothetical protein
MLKNMPITQKPVVLCHFSSNCYHIIYTVPIADRRAHNRAEKGIRRYQNCWKTLHYITSRILTEKIVYGRFCAYFNPLGIQTLDDR